MGEIADLMLDGTLCEGCGVFLDGQQPGFTRLCRDCKKAEGRVPPAAPLSLKLACPTCGKKLATPGGLHAHMRAMHSAGLVACPACGKEVKRTGLRDHTRALHAQPSSTTP